jgi:thioredoxin/glutathione reductase (selenoprotein)
MDETNLLVLSFPEPKEGMKAFLKGETDKVPDTVPLPPQPPAHKGTERKTPEQVLGHSVDPDTEPGRQFDYDFFVIGGGSGGLSAAKRAAEHGVRVALADFVVPSPQGTKWGLGGTCVNVGCIPKKLMHTAALQGELLKHSAPAFGWPESTAQCDWATLRQNVDMHIKSLNFGYGVELRKKNVKYFNSYARFVDNHTLELTDKNGAKSTVTSRRILIATGGRPTFPDIPGAKEFGVSSDDIFKLAKDPGRTLVVGASYVALECAGFLTGIGRPSTVMMRSIPLRGFDQDMARRVVDYMETAGTAFLKGCVPVAVEKQADGSLVVSYKDSEGKVEKFACDTVLFATGRTPETHGIGLSTTGVQLSKSGKIVVDEFERTSVPHIYAIGDIIEGGMELTPVAIKAGRLLADRLYNRGSALMNYKTVPTTVFTPLEYGCVGLSEEAAEEKYGMVEVYHTSFTPLEWTVPHLAANICYLKIIVNPFDNERVLGFHILAPNAGEITQGVAIAVAAGVTKQAFDDCIGIHPTIAEEVTTLRITKSSGLSAEKGSC